MTLPSYARIVELQLSVGVAEADAQRRPLLNSRAPAVSPTEIWRGQIALAPLTVGDTQRLQSWIETLDGRVTTFFVPMVPGYATHPNTINTTLAATCAAGADRITLASAVDILPGTLLALGAPGSADYQMVEVVETERAGVHYIAPRNRAARAVGLAVTGGTVSAALRLARDDVAASTGLSSGAATLDVIEAI
jgi:hypothetical protein